MWEPHRENAGGHGSSNNISGSVKHQHYSLHPNEPKRFKLHTSIAYGAAGSTSARHIHIYFLYFHMEKKELLLALHSWQSVKSKLRHNSPKKLKRRSLNITLSIIIQKAVPSWTATIN